MQSNTTVPQWVTYWLYGPGATDLPTKTHPTYSAAAGYLMAGFALEGEGNDHEGTVAHCFTAIGNLASSLTQAPPAQGVYVPCTPTAFGYAVVLVGSPLHAQVHAVALSHQ